MTIAAGFMHVGIAVLCFITAFVFAAQRFVLAAWAYFFVGVYFVVCAYGAFRGGVLS